MNRKRASRLPFFVLALSLLSALILAACGGSDTSDNTATNATAEPAPAATAESTTAPAPAGTEPATTPAEPQPTATTAPAPTAEVAGSSEPTSGCGSGAQAGRTTQTLVFEDRDRTFEQLLPSNYDDQAPLPVVLNWHGLGSTGAEQILFSGYGELAEREGFIVIAPTGIPAPGGTRNSWEISPDQDTTRDDLAFANELLDTVIDTLCVDPNRVYTTGMSNGGYFSAVLICEMSERIAAAASVGALTHNDNCDPARNVPYIGFHGTDDLVVPYDGGGASTLSPGEVIPLFELSIPDEFAEFATDAGCDLAPVVADYAPTVKAITYSNCDDTTDRVFYEIEGGGHTWPGSLVSRAISEGVGIGVTSMDIDASQVSWDFFEQHRLSD